MPKKAKTAADETTLVDDLGIYDDPAAKKTADADPVAALSAQVAVLAKGFETLSEATKKMQGLTMSMLTQGATKPAPQADPAAATSADAPKMPDPVIDPEGYATALAAKVGTAIEDRFTKQAGATKQQQTQDAKADALWVEFAEAQPEMAKDQDKVEFATTKVVKRAQARGVNMDQYMYVTSKQFFEDVSAEYEKQFGPASDDKKPAGDEEVPAKDRPDPGATRTGGTFGGGVSGGKPAGGGKDEKPGDLVAELQEVQRKTGFM